MLGSSEALVVLMVIMLLFGSSQIPKLARNLGKAQKELQDALRGDDDADDSGVDARERVDDTAAH